MLPGRFAAIFVLPFIAGDGGGRVRFQTNHVWSKNCKSQHIFHVMETCTRTSAAPGRSQMVHWRWEGKPMPNGLTTGELGETKHSSAWWHLLRLQYILYRRNIYNRLKHSTASRWSPNVAMIEISNTPVLVSVVNVQRHRQNVQTYWHCRMTTHASCCWLILHAWNGNTNGTCSWQLRSTKIFINYAFALWFHWEYSCTKSNKRVVV